MNRASTMNQTDAHKQQQSVAYIASHSLAILRVVNTIMSGEIISKSSVDKRPFGYIT
jgi:hypothetical protein